MHFNAGLNLENGIKSIILLKAVWAGIYSITKIVIISHINKTSLINEKGKNINMPNLKRNNNNPKTATVSTTNEMEGFL